MLQIFGLRDGQIAEVTADQQPPPAPDKLLWVDLLNPTAAEEQQVEAMLGINVPTREEMGEIEDSARLYREGEVLVMTAIVIDGAAQERPSRAPVTFLLTPRHLLCVRYADPQAFKLFYARCRQHPAAHASAADLFLSMLESIVERAADILEIAEEELHAISARLFFGPEGKRKATRVEVELNALIKRLGRKNMTVAILRESLLSVGRMIAFARDRAPLAFSEDVSGRLQQVERDIRSLAQYEQQLTSQIAYLHDATLGLINLEQNRIIKVFSIAAVLFLPPTLVGTVYGMNFVHMPELGWLFGYPFALGLMVVSGLLPYLFFKWRGWL